jgi:hypothetical protein
MTLASVLVGGWKSLIPGLDLAPAHGHSGASPFAEVTAFTQAAAALATYQATAGSYVGAQLSPTSPVQLAWSSDSQYCLQSTDLHLVGPVGAPQPGLCPAL